MSTAERRRGTGTKVPMNSAASGFVNPFISPALSCTSVVAASSRSRSG